MGFEHLDYAMALNNLSILYFRMERYKDAVANLKLAKDIRLKKLGKEHPLVALSINILASIMMEIGDYEQALPLLINAKKTIEQVGGNRHPK